MCLKKSASQSPFNVIKKKHVSVLRDVKSHPDNIFHSGTYIIIHLWELKRSHDVQWKMTAEWEGRGLWGDEILQVTSLTYIGVWQMWQLMSIQFMFQKSLEIICNTLHFFFWETTSYCVLFIYDDGN